MELTDALSALPAYWTWWMTATLIGGIPLTIALASLERFTTQTSTAILISGIVLTASATVVPATIRYDHHRGAAVQIVAGYLAEQNLTVLEPVKIRTGHAVGRVVTPDDEVRWVHLEWIPNPRAALNGAGVSPTAEVVTLTLSDTRPDVYIANGIFLSGRIS